MHADDALKRFIKASSNSHGWVSYSSFSLESWKSYAAKRLMRETLSNFGRTRSNTSTGEIELLCLTILEFSKLGAERRRVLFFLSPSILMLVGKH